MEQLIRNGLEAMDLLPQTPDRAPAQLAEYGRLLLEKNQVMNLTAITEPERVAQLHMLDSAALLKGADFQDKTLIDVGTGAGFPGIPLKILVPSLQVTLLDSLNESYPENHFEQLSLSNVSAAMGTKFLQKSLVAVVFALVLILLYIALRFKNIGGLTGGMMAVLALVNDLMVVFGTFVLLRTALDGNFIAAMLTILGYSINDTVVVYDRIRENRTLMGKKASFEELVNHSVNQSARRTLITTITTVMALGVMCIVAKLYGLDSIFTFAFPLMMGMISGVYTSLCVSTSAWVLWSERKPKTKA